MARKRRSSGDGDQDINLAPFMNMVVILIPLLLLSVVFVKVGVINITAPKLSTGPPSEEQPDPDEEPLNLTIAVNPKGFRIAATGATLPELQGCPTPGPTICLEKQDADVADQFDRARELFRKGQTADGEKALNKALSAYNWPELYNQLVKIKNEYPEETVVNLSADPDVPYAAMVRVMDVARYRLKKDEYEESSKFWSADYKKKGNNYVKLFSDPVLAIAQ
jgi:biopolymer transport protein ExbD